MYTYVCTGACVHIIESFIIGAYTLFHPIKTTPSHQPLRCPVTVGPHFLLRGQTVTRSAVWAKTAPQWRPSASRCFYVLFFFWPRFHWRLKMVNRTEGGNPLFSIGTTSTILYKWPKDQRLRNWTFSQDMIKQLAWRQNLALNLSLRSTKYDLVLGHYASSSSTERTEKRTNLSCNLKAPEGKNDTKSSIKQLNTPAWSKTFWGPKMTLEFWAHQNVSPSIALIQTRNGFAPTGDTFFW